MILLEQYITEELIRVIIKGIDIHIIKNIQIEKSEDIKVKYIEVAVTRRYLIIGGL